MMQSAEELEAQAQAVRMQEDQLQDRMARGHRLDEAYEQLVNSTRVQLSRFPEALEFQLGALEAARQRIHEKLEAVSYWKRASLKCGRPDWYGGPAEDALLWPALRARLEDQGRNPDEVAGVDRESTSVLSLLDNPGLERFSTRGLVMGHVQSGKTGNMAAVISKAADTPYKFFVVLSGMTDSLRNQTQERLNKDIVENGHEARWVSWTNLDVVRQDGTVEKGDFHHPANVAFPLDGPARHIAVVKKNAAVLRRLRNKLRSTPRSVLEHTPFLIIDDECDQASVNSAQLRNAISATNRVIREIVEHLPRVAYVGYTATPFANVLINPSDAEDLYPRDFIHPLIRPPSYFGAQELFGREALQGESTDVDAGFDMIRIVPDQEANDLRPAPRRANDFEFNVSASLSSAIRYFVLATAARGLRGQGDDHSSMLIHTSMLNTVHRSADVAVSAFMTQLTERLRTGDKPFLDELRILWEEESDRVRAEDFGLQRIPFGDLAPHLHQVAASIQVKVENWRSQDRIDYSQPGRRYIVIGGNVLARGLTLYGLVVSFFMRTSSQYDTLMQMGRWFGYRKGFADLPRVWMEADVRDYFFDLATIEEEIRRDVARYAEENLTPAQFAVRIRRIPGLAITARSKMRDARTAQIGYEGEHVQTIRFRRREPDWLNRNWQAGVRLVDADGITSRSGSSFVKKGVPVAAVRQFLSEYEVERNSRMQRDMLLAYVDKLARDERPFTTWNVVVIGSENCDLTSEPFGSLGRVKAVTRTPMENSGEVAFIKALMSRRDLTLDMTSVPAEIDAMTWDAIKQIRLEQRLPPLLVLYPIDRNSTPAGGRRSNREPMDAAMDVLGLGIVFPGQPGAGVEYVQADLQPEDAEEAFVGENAIPEEIVGEPSEPV